MGWEQSYRAKVDANVKAIAELKKGWKKGPQGDRGLKGEAGPAGKDGKDGKNLTSKSKK